MNRYKTIKVKLGWIGVFQTYMNWRNFFALYWTFIHTKLHPETEFGFTICGFALPIIDRHRSLFALRWYTWDGRPAGMLSISLLYLPSLDFRIGNGTSWRWIRWENYHFYKCRKNNGF